MGDYFPDGISIKEDAFKSLRSKLMVLWHLSKREPAGALTPRWRPAGRGKFGAGGGEQVRDRTGGSPMAGFRRVKTICTKGRGTGRHEHGGVQNRPAHLVLKSIELA